MDSNKKNEISNSVSEICENFSMLTDNIDKIDRKIEFITKIFYKLSYNATLDTSDTNSYLKFQIELLNIEKNYYNGVRNSIKNKFVSELYSISELILMLLGSIENINIDDNNGKNNILKKVSKIKKDDDTETSSIIENVNNTLNNLMLVKEFIDLFDVFIQETIQTNRKDNIHCNNFKVNLENKKQHILLEYNKYYGKIEELINYFIECTHELKTQLKYQKLLSFLTDKKEDKSI